MSENSEKIIKILLESAKEGRNIKIGKAVCPGRVVQVTIKSGAGYSKDIIYGWLINALEETNWEIPFEMIESISLE